MPGPPQPAAACAGTIAILLRRGNLATAVLAIAAVPMLAWRTQPRAEMFTEVLFAAFVSLLWQYHKTGRAPLWLLPVLMALWVNLHLGFIAGLAMWGAYVLLECDDLARRPTRAQALTRLKRAAPWMGLTVLATLLNPWGPRLFLAIARQNRIMRIHSRWIEEWAQVRLTPATVTDFFSWRGPGSSFLWVLAAACLAILVALYRRRLAAALVLGAAIYAVLHAVRLQGPFSSLVVVIGGALIGEALHQFVIRRAISQRIVAIASPGLIVVLAVFVAVRVADLVSNRYYLSAANNMVVFGTDDFPLFPEGAAEFIQRERLPRNILNDFNSGGFLAWKLDPAYPDYIDGRSVPFGPELFLNLEKLMQDSPDSSAWHREADSRDINTLIFSLDHVIGGGLSALDKFCASRQWRPVFLDPYGAVFVRATAANADMISRLQLDCATLTFHDAPAANSVRHSAKRFRYLVNAASILIVLDRGAEALAKLQEAEAVFEASPYLHYAKGSALNGLGRNAEAEKELVRSVQLGSEDAPYALARLYDDQGRYREEARVLREAADKSTQPSWLYLKLGYAQLAMGQREDALQSFEEADKQSPFQYEAGALGADFRAQLAEGRRRAGSGQ